MGSPTSLSLTTLSGIALEPRNGVTFGSAIQLSYQLEPLKFWQSPDLDGKGQGKELGWFLSGDLRLQPGGDPELLSTVLGLGTGISGRNDLWGVKTQAGLRSPMIVGASTRGVVGVSGWFPVRKWTGTVDVTTDLGSDGKPTGHATVLAGIIKRF